MSKTTYTEKDINSASTVDLQVMYEKLTGKATSDRNKGKLMARVLRLNKYVNEAAKADGKKGSNVIKPKSPLDTSAFEGDVSKDAKPAKVERKKAIKAQVEKSKPVAAPDASPSSATPKPANVFAKIRASAIPATGKIAAVVADKVEKAKVPKPARASGAARRSRGESETCKVLSELTPGTVLEHHFRGGTSVRVTVEIPPNEDGKGGQYKYKNKKYDSLRTIAEETAGIAWNVLLFFGLKPYPKHRKTEKPESTAK